MVFDIPPPHWHLHVLAFCPIYATFVHSGATPIPSTSSHYPMFLSSILEKRPTLIHTRLFCVVQNLSSEGQYQPSRANSL
jgi:hypothetical protein